MFGSKIRSWMENHIVRPRRKGNKNKNANSVLAPANNITNGQKSISNHGEPTIGCTARRSEVSPIQSHTTSRVGWQSPQDDELCLSTDTIHPFHVRSTTTSPRNALRSQSTHQNGAQYSKSVDSKFLMRTFSEENAKNDGKIDRKLNNLDDVAHKSNGILLPHGYRKRQMYECREEFFNRVEEDVQKNGFYCSERENQNGIKTVSEKTYQQQQNDVTHFHDRNRFEQKLNHEIKDSPPTNESIRCNGATEEFISLRSKNGHIYGRIMNGKAVKEKQCTTIGENIRLDRPIPMLPPPPSTPPPPITHLSKQTKHESLYLEQNGCNRNNFNGHGYDIPNGCMREMSPRDVHQRRLIRSSPLPQTHQHHQQQQQFYSNKAPLMNGTHLNANRPLSHVIMNSLSSPESAYSTGYSTDGTSPVNAGTSNAPEYYINMRTGTHYFPRGVNGVAAVERNCQKFGLNKIEETANESGTQVSNHRRTESFDFTRCNVAIASATNANSSIVMRTMSPDIQRRLAYENYRGFESPSPRQRCRIRTNPWLTMTESGSQAQTSNASKIMDSETGSTSSGIKSNSADDKRRKANAKNLVLSESEDSSTSTEIEMIRKASSPRANVRRRIEKQLSECLPPASMADSEDEDATFNELMGKFDESYVYEKETDILSDSDPTECVSEFDTGQDGGDECDTEDMLEINYIDTESIQEVSEREIIRNTGSCTYHQTQVKRTPRRSNRSESSTGSRRKKRLTRTRKRNSECHERDHSQASSKTISPNRFRGSRSVGGTPVSLRRNQKDKRNTSTPKSAPLNNRCNSLTFTEFHSIRSRFLAIAESEKAILKADIEADVKYKQLIHEAETILVSMKTTALRETPVPSPSRRICTMPPNKRVEMLRNCEVDLRRDSSKTQKTESIDLITPPPASPCLSLQRMSPRKTHITNFIHQNGNAIEVGALRNRLADPNESNFHDVKRSPCLQKNGNRIKMHPPKSPTPRRRYRSQSPRICIEESDSDESEINGRHRKPHITTTKETKLRHSIKKMHQQNDGSIINANIYNNNGVVPNEEINNHAFRAIDLVNQNTESFYCPQSEPLKRKIYSEKTLDRLQKSLEVESEIPREALLRKISILRRERQQQHAASIRSHSVDAYDPNNKTESADKRMLILNTIEDLKRSLEEQSIELRVCDINANGDE